MSPRIATSSSFLSLSAPSPLSLSLTPSVRLLPPPSSLPSFLLRFPLLPSSPTPPNLYNFLILAISAVFAKFASLNSTRVPFMEAERCWDTVDDVMLWSVDSLMARRLVVVAVIPNTRRDCAIWVHDMVSIYVWASRRRIASQMYTLLLAPRLKTISLCTFLLFNCLFR